MTALHWYKSSYSTNETAACVEVALAPQTIHIRDSKHINGDQLTFPRERWTAFIGYAAER
ncbi:DUF397 domain-containing protein [Streptomyces sp. NPDC093252]|uniref:DUF397 domain-containing protein n=1 Tax=Streptomyces sp. NPDC093252 TaxID=3154980 RepID=UPI00342637E0